jgi:hypothetical protein
MTSAAATSAPSTAGPTQEAPKPPALLSSLSPNAAAMYSSAPSGVQASFDSSASAAGDVAPPDFKPGFTDKITANPNGTYTVKSDYAPDQTYKLPKPAAPAGGGGYGGIGGPTGAPTIEQLEAQFLLPGEKEKFLGDVAYMQAQNEKTKVLHDLEITAQEKILAEQAGVTKAFAEGQAKQAEDDAEFRAWHGKEMQTLQAESDKVANMKLDQGRLFKYQNTGDAVMASVAMALGALGGAFSQSLLGSADNPFVTSLNRAVERDLAAQQAEIENKKAGVVRKEGLLSQRYKQYGDMAVAKNAARLDAYKIALVQVNQMAAKLGTESAKVNAEKASMALDKQVADATANHDLMLQSQYQKWKALQIQQQQAAAAAAAAKADEERKYWRGVAGEMLKKDGTVPVFDQTTGQPIGAMDPTTGQLVGPDGLGSGGGNKAQPVTLIKEFNAEGQPEYYDAKAYNPESATALKKSTEAYDQAKQDIKILKDLRKKHGGGAIYSPEDQDIADAAIGRLQLQVKELGKLGALSGSDLDLIKKQIPNDALAVKPAAALIGQDPIGVKINELDKGLDRMYKASVNAHMKAPASSKSAAPLKAVP